MAEDFLALMQQLGPDLMQDMARRALVLERVAVLEPVGRRQLAARLNLPEREVRSIATFLKEEGFLRLDAAGMALTEKGQRALPGAREFSRGLRGLTRLEMRLAEALQIGRVCIVSGDCDSDAQVLEDVGRLAAQRLPGYLHSGSTLAVTGGGTMAQVAGAVQTPAPMNVMVVPARGGLGRTLETQASTLAAEIARRIGGHHRLIHVPDHLDEDALAQLRKLPEVQETLELVQRADVILHGIGRAEDMARSRQMSAQLLHRLTEQGAVAEALGYYFDAAGQCLYASSSVGVDLARLSPSCQMIAVAAGRRKARAMIAVLRHYRHALLVTDEGAAEEMLRLLDASL